jgi:transposase
MTAGPVYPSDTTDAQWAVLEPRARQVMAGLVKASGRPVEHDLRAMVDAVFYVVKNGVEWRALPVDFPPWPCFTDTSGQAHAAVDLRMTRSQATRTLIPKLTVRPRAHSGHMMSSSAARR